MSEEQKRKVAFDLARAGFYLVALVISTHLFIALATIFACIYVGYEFSMLILKNPDLVAKLPQTCAANRESLLELLSAALAAALAFSGGRSIPKE